jgi:hypothetical protein
LGAKLGENLVSYGSPANIAANTEIAWTIRGQADMK